MEHSVHHYEDGGVRYEKAVIPGEAFWAEVVVPEKDGSKTFIGRVANNIRHADFKHGDLVEFAWTPEPGQSDDGQWREYWAWRPQRLASN
jgi:hypothetical protein